MTAHHLHAAALPPPTHDQVVAQMQKMQQQMQQQMQQNMQQMEDVVLAHLSNVWCYRLEEPIKHFPNAAGQPAPHCIPATLGALDALNSNNSRTCLQYYGLQGNGTVVERRRRLAEHLGVKLVHPSQAQEDRLQGIDCRQRRADAWHRNYSALDGTDFLVSFPNDNGDPAPQSFPRTLQALLDLSDDDLVELNAHYELEGGNVRRLWLFLGVASRFTFKPVF
jgi:Protein of unknown function (DUF3294)